MLEDTKPQYRGRLVGAFSFLFLVDVVLLIVALCLWDFVVSGSKFVDGIDYSCHIFIDESLVERYAQFFTVDAFGDGQ